MVMDWREMAGRPTFGPGVDTGSWNPFQGAWEGVVRVAEPPTLRKGPGGWRHDATSVAAGISASSTSLFTDALDPARAWTIAAAWLIACGVDIYYLYMLVRRPTYILDFALTLFMNHLILTTYYASFPSSLFFWAVMVSGTVMIIVCAEQLCVRREMRDGLGVVPNLEPASEPSPEEVELLERG